MRAVVYWTRKDIAVAAAPPVFITGVTLVDGQGNPVDEFTGMPPEAGILQIEKDEIHEVMFINVSE